MDKWTSGQPQQWTTPLLKCLARSRSGPQTDPENLRKTLVFACFPGRNPQFSPGQREPVRAFNGAARICARPTCGETDAPRPCPPHCPPLLFRPGWGFGRGNRALSARKPRNGVGSYRKPPKVSDIYDYPPPAAGAGGPRPLTPGVASRLATPGASPRGQWTSGQLPPGTVHRSGQLQPWTVPRGASPALSPACIPRIVQTCTKCGNISQIRIKPGGPGVGSCNIAL